MATTARASRYRQAIGKQSGEGTAQGTPAWEYSLYDGSIKPTQSEVPHEVVDTDDLPLGYYKQNAQGMGEVTVASDLDTIGYLWYAHLGANAVTGTGSDRTNTITRSYTKPFSTVYQMRPDVVGGTDVWERGGNGVLRGIELSGTKGEPVKHACDFIFKTFEYGKSAPTPTNNRRIGTADTNLVGMIGSTLLLDLAATPGATQVRNIESFVITSKYESAEWIQTDELTPRYLSLGAHTIGASVDMVFQSFAAYTSTFFGSATPAGDMTLSNIVVNGGLDFSFPLVGAAADADRILQIQLPSVRFTVSPPEPAAGGDAVRITLTASAQKPTSGEAITAIVKNSQAGY